MQLDYAHFRSRHELLPFPGGSRGHTYLYTGIADEFQTYARQFRLPGDVLVEETDRYKQALLHKQLAIECFSRAKLSILKNGLV